MKPLTHTQYRLAPDNQLREEVTGSIRYYPYSKPYLTCGSKEGGLNGEPRVLHSETLVSTFRAPSHSLRSLETHCKVVAYGDAKGYQ